MRLLRRNGGCEELATSRRPEASPIYSILSHIWGTTSEEVTYRNLISHENPSSKEHSGDASTAKRKIQLQPHVDRPKYDIPPQEWWLCADVVAFVGVLSSTVLLYDYSAFRHRRGGGSDSFLLDPSWNWSSIATMFFPGGGNGASRRQGPIKPWSVERPSLLFHEPSPWLLVAAIIAYHLAFRHLHVVLSSRSRFHIHILLAGGLASLLGAFIGGLDMLDTALVVVPVGVDISLLLSYVIGLRWAAAGSIPSELGGLCKISMDKDIEARLSNHSGVDTM